MDTSKKKTIKSIRPNYSIIRVACLEPERIALKLVREGLYDVKVGQALNYSTTQIET